MKNYSLEIIQQAKSMWEDGVTQKTIAKKLGIKRVNTISEWRRKNEWKRSKNFALDADQKKTWKDIAEVALEFLKKEENFKNVKDAMIVYERAVNHLKDIQKDHKKVDSNATLLRILSGEEEELIEDEDSVESEKL